MLDHSKVLLLQKYLEKYLNGKTYDEMPSLEQIETVSI